MKTVKSRALEDSDPHLAARQADFDEDALWEAYVALERKKNPNPYQESRGADAWFDSAPLASSTPGGSAEGRGGDLEPLDAGTFVGARKPLPVRALVVAAGGVVVAGALIAQMVGGGYLPRVHRAAQTPVAARPTLAAPTAGAIVSSANLDAEPVETAPAGARTTAIESRRQSHSALNSTPAGGRGHGRDARTQHARPTRFAENPATFEPARRNVSADEPIARTAPTGASRSSASDQGSAATAGVKDYRATQAEYARQLRSYQEAMVEYDQHVTRAPPPFPPRHTYNSAAAMDALPWRP